MCTHVAKNKQYTYVHLGKWPFQLSTLTLGIEKKIENSELTIQSYLEYYLINVAGMCIIYDKPDSILGICTFVRFTSLKKKNENK